MLLSPHLLPDGTNSVVRRHAFLVTYDFVAMAWRSISYRQAIHQYLRSIGFSGTQVRLNTLSWVSKPPLILTFVAHYQCT